MRNIILPSLSALRCFEAAARHQSFTLAAEEVRLTQSSVSRHIKDLEYIIGFELFRRIGRRVVLTEAGTRFAQEIGIDLERLRQTVFRAIATGQAPQSLKIASLPTFASRWLIPRLPDFEARYPDCNIGVGTRVEPFDFDSERFDVAIHFGTTDWPGASLTKLCQEEVIVVAAPDVFKTYDFSCADKIQEAPLLHLENRPMEWLEWMRSAGLGQDLQLSGKFFDQFSMMIAGALAGLGIALVPNYLVEKELASGTLVKAHPHVLSTENAYFLATPAGAPNEMAGYFIQWIRQQVSQK